MRGGSMRRFSPYEGTTQYGGALQIPNVVSGVGKTVKRAVKRKAQGVAQGVANRMIDRAAGHLTKRAKRRVADLLGV